LFANALASRMSPCRCRSSSFPLPTPPPPPRLPPVKAFDPFIPADSTDPSWGCCPWRAGQTIFFFFFTLVTGPRRSLSLKLSPSRRPGPNAWGVHLAPANPLWQAGSCPPEAARDGTARQVCALSSHLYLAVNFVSLVSRSPAAETSRPSKLLQQAF